jgi:pantothenate kinase
VALFALRGSYHHPSWPHILVTLGTTVSIHKMPGFCTL